MTTVPRILIVIGTRPEAIKMAPVHDALRRLEPAFETKLALSGQHLDLVEPALDIFGLAPDYRLNVMREGQNVADVVSRVLLGLRDILREAAPDVLLVQGDTATVFAASLAGFLEQVKVGHVEAGLRSHDRYAPFPEEILRRLTDVASEYHFAPTIRARDELLRENASPDSVFVTGNTVVDALLSVARRKRPVKDPALAEIRSRVRGGEARLVLLTAHRREAFGPPLTEIFRAVRDVADAHPDVCVLYPVHPNPNVLVPARELLADHPRIRLTEPLDYLDLVAALESAALVMTDSGGIQEEAPTFGAPVLVLRDVTERPEGVEAGVAELVGTDRRLIAERARAALSREPGLEPPRNPYGDGRAGERIADILAADLLGRTRRIEDWAG
ncbi:MAG: UDP-N-acetylglucosamine 2-epimerase (non-hydrolyzing) [Gemmatimonadetes bacterium]|nr:UDP-N-acetylglucosamine 2-epimerase (non-hydrolyzing) [Candidatus Palauibacter australiensis]